MARPGVSYEEAKQVFTSILVQGDSLSIQRARASHGSGSNSTWQQHLSKFREEQKGKSIRTLPESFPEELVPMFEQLWLKANEAAEKRFEQEKTQNKEKEADYKQEIAGLDIRIKGLHDDLANARENIETLEEAHAHLDHALNEKEQHFIRSNTKNNAQIESLVDKNKEQTTLLEEQKELNKNLLSQHENSFVTLDSKHRKDIARLETSEAKWMSLYDESKQNEKQVTGKLERLTIENTELKAIEKQKIQIETTLQNTEQQMEKLESKLAQSELTQNVLLRENESLKIQLKETLKSHSKIESELAKLQSKISTLKKSPNQSNKKPQTKT